jgi:hypothetical protein
VDVELKVNFDGGIERALDRLGLTADEGEARLVAFVEDVSVGAGLPLLHAGVVLRARQEGSKPVKSTVKLRPCRLSQLPPDWLARARQGDEEDRRVEQDWSGDRRVLAASHDAKRKGVDLDEVLEGGPAGALFDVRQVAFLREATGLAVDLDELAVLGPILATKWSEVKPLERLDAEAERWRLDDLDFLEISLRREPGTASSARAELEAELRRLGLEPASEQRPKTEAVLEHLLDERGV